MQCQISLLTNLDLCESQVSYRLPTLWTQERKLQSSLERLNLIMAGLAASMCSLDSRMQLQDHPTVEGMRPAWLTRLIRVHAIANTFSNSTCT